MNIFIIMKTDSLFSIPEPLPISRIHHFPLLSLCHKKSSAMNLSQKLHPKLCTFMDAFDLMTSLSATFPTYILRALSADYIKVRSCSIPNTHGKSPSMNYGTEC